MSSHTSSTEINIDTINLSEFEPAYIFLIKTHIKSAEEQATNVKSFGHFKDREIAINWLVENGFYLEQDTKGGIPSLKNDHGFWIYSAGRHGAVIIIGNEAFEYLEVDIIKNYPLPIFDTFAKTQHS
jgi:hypothetical protein